MRISKLATALAVALPLAALAQPALAGEDKLITLEPSTAWNLDMGEHKCRLARIFGEGEQKAVFVLEQWDPSAMANLMVAGEPFKPYRERKMAFEFSQGGDRQEFELLGASLDDFGKAILKTTYVVANEAPPEDGKTDGDSANTLPHYGQLDSEGAEKVEWLTFSQKGAKPVRLKLGSMRAPLAAMNSCMDNLVTAWGFDPNEQRAIVTGPKITNMEDVVRRIVKVYPSKALSKGKQADFHMRMTIDTGGKVESCTLLDQTTAEGFDLENHPCKMFERYAEIEPARNAAGEPVRTFLAERVSYRVQ